MGLLRNLFAYVGSYVYHYKVELLLSVNFVLLLTVFKLSSSSSSSLRGNQRKYVKPTTEDSEKIEEGEKEIDEEEPPHVPYQPTALNMTDEKRLEKTKEFYNLVNGRRSVRFLDPNRPVPLDVVKHLIMSATTAPSGAHCQPWTYAVVSDPSIKRELRNIIEKEEKVNYERRMGKKWVDDLKPVGTTWKKPYLEDAPHIIIVFKQTHGQNNDGTRKTHYYVEESVALSCGILLTAIENAGLVTVTTTPLNAGPQIRNLLKRPNNEKVVILLPLGHPSPEATVPNFERKALNEVAAFY